MQNLTETILVQFVLPLNQESIQVRQMQNLAHRWLSQFLFLEYDLPMSRSPPVLKLEQISFWSLHKFKRFWEWHFLYFLVWHFEKESFPRQIFRGEILGDTNTSVIALNILASEISIQWGYCHNFLITITLGRISTLHRMKPGLPYVPGKRLMIRHVNIRTT